MSLISNPLTIRAIKTSVFSAAQNLFEFIKSQVPIELVQEGMVLVVTSKIVSLAENRLVQPQGLDKTDLVKKEADVYLGQIGYGCHLTIKEGLFIPSAGIDESNSKDGSYILFPENPTASAQKLWQELRQAWDLKNLGIIMSDSHTSPLRQGVTGICLAYWGFKAVRNMVGSKDLFGRELKMTQQNLADGLSAAAVLMMGEGRESQPLALIHGAELEFQEHSDSRELRMPLEEDLYYPILKHLQSSQDQ